jgi:hypothetical protein
MPCPASDWAWDNHASKLGRKGIALSALVGFGGFTNPAAGENLAPKRNPD